jgi:uncharacterized protein YjbK
LEQELDLSIATSVINNPSIILNHQDIPLVKVLIDELTSTEIIISEQFSNTRQIYSYEGLKLEVDETEYTFGNAFEIEIESEKPEEAKALVVDLLNENGIEYTFSKRSKYGNLKAGSVL